MIRFSDKMENVENMIVSTFIDCYKSDNISEFISIVNNLTRASDKKQLLEHSILESILYLEINFDEFYIVKYLYENKLDKWFDDINTNLVKVVRLLLRIIRVHNVHMLKYFMETIGFNRCFCCNLRNIMKQCTTSDGEYIRKFMGMKYITYARDFEFVKFFCENIITTESLAHDNKIIKKIIPKLNFKKEQIFEIETILFLKMNKNYDYELNEWLIKEVGNNYVKFRNKYVRLMGVISNNLLKKVYGDVIFIYKN